MIRAVFAGLCLLCGAAATAAEQPLQPPDYNEHVAPILRKYCLGCHDGETAEGELILESFEKLLQGGGRGASIVPGRSEQSRLILALEGRIKPAMPPEGSEPPTPEEVAILKAWIDAGAAGPTGPPDPTRLVSPKVDLLTSNPRRAIRATAWSHDGKHIALAGYGEVRLIAADSRTVVRRLTGHRGPVNDVRFSADDRYLIAAGGEPGLFGEARLWHVADGKLQKVFTAHKDSLYAALLGPQQKLLATAGYDEDIILWEVDSGRPTATLEGHHGAIFDLALRHDGRILVSVSGDRTAKLWDVERAAPLDTFGQSREELYAAAFSPDGRFLAAGGVDRRIRLWRLSDSGQAGTNQLLTARFAHQGPILRLAYSPDGRLLASAAEDRTVKIWTAAPLDLRRTLPDQSDWPAAMAFSPDGNRLLVGRLDGSYDIYDTQAGKVVPPPVPTLAALWPRGIQRGVATNVTLSGKHLDAATGLKLSHPGLRGRILPIAGRSGSLRVELLATAELQRGIYEVAVTTPGGTSNTTKLFVDDLPQQVEVEANDTLRQPTSAPLPVSFWGRVLSPGDVDDFAFEALAGQTIVMNLAADELGSKLNGVLTLYDADGHLVTSNNDFDGEPDPFLAFTVKKAGTYHVAVSDLLLSGSGQHFYRLSVGEFAFVTGCFPLSVPSGTEMDVELVGFNLPGGAKVRVKAAGQPTVRLKVDSARFRSRRPIVLAVGRLPETVEAEPNDLPPTATRLHVPATVGGRVFQETAGNAADVDLFRFEARRGESWVIETDAARRGSPVDTVIDVLDEKGQPLKRLLLQATRDTYINFRSITSAQPGARLANWEEMKLNQFVYLDGEVCKIFRMPQGPDSDILFYAVGGSRRGYFDTSPTAHANLSFCYIVEPVPPGREPAANGLPAFPLFFTNDDDGEREVGRDSRLTFTAPADGAFLVRVRDVRSLGGDRFAYRLTIRRPKPDFSIRIAGRNPTVARGGGKRLPVTAVRSDGFEGPITLEVTGLPPGFAANTPLVIEQGHRQVSLLVTAAGDASAPLTENADISKVVATATIDSQRVRREVGTLGRLRLGPKPKLHITLEPAELVIAPGKTIAAHITVERNGFDKRIRLDVENLPHGVIVDNIGLNGVLIPEGQTRRKIFLTAADWVPEMTRPCHAITTEPAGETSAFVRLHVQRTSAVAQVDATP